MIDLTDSPIDAASLLASVQDPSCGAAVLFVGSVRDQTGDRPVTRMHYDAHPALARKELQAVADEVAKRWPTVRLAMVHRIGDVQLAEASVAVAAAAPHRVEAFEAGRYAIDTLKERVPIWKKEFSPDGNEWIHGEERLPAEEP